jgi:hypothetical protein
MDEDLTTEHHLTVPPLELVVEEDLTETGLIIVPVVTDKVDKVGMVLSDMEEEPLLELLKKLLFL